MRSPIPGAPAPGRHRIVRSAGIPALLLATCATLVVAARFGHTPSSQERTEDCYSHTTLNDYILQAQRAAARDAVLRRLDPTVTDTITALERILEMEIPRSVNHHDCQALIERGNHQAVIAIYADSRTLMMTNLDFEAAAGTAFRVALFENRSSGKRHDETGIGEGVGACLFIGLRTGGQSTNESDWWAARGACTLQTIPANQGAGLRITRWSGSIPAEDYLPVVRWHWNQQNGKHTFGMKCGEGWCVAGMGKPTFHETPCGDLTYPGSMDVQPLATIDRGSLKLRRGTAYICPTTELKTLNTVDDYRSPRRVARVYIKGAVGWYKGVFRTGDDAQYGPNVVSLMFVPGLDTDDNRSWIMKVERPDGSTALRQVHRNVSGGGRPARTVRWRWLPDDETNWIWCAGGCCEDVPPPPE